MFTRQQSTANTSDKTGYSLYDANGIALMRAVPFSIGGNNLFSQTTQMGYYMCYNTVERNGADAKPAVNADLVRIMCLRSFSVL